MKTNSNTGVAVAAVRKAEHPQHESWKKRADTHAPKGVRTFAKETTPGRHRSNDQRTNSTKGLQY